MRMDTKSQRDRTVEMWANNSCDPNSTALVGNLLIRKGNAIEVVKVR